MIERHVNVLLLVVLSWTKQWHLYWGCQFLMLLCPYGEAFLSVYPLCPFVIYYKTLFFLKAGILLTPYRGFLYAISLIRSVSIWSSFIYGIITIYRAAYILKLTCPEFFQPEMLFYIINHSSSHFKALVLF